MLKSMETQEFQRITDFFERIHFATEQKLKIIAEYPFITDFSINAVSDKSSGLSKQWASYMNDALYNSFDIYFRNIDTAKFKKDVNPKQIYQMMLWMSEGYINEKKRMNTPIILEDFLAVFKTWETLMKKACYKEEI